MMFKSLNGLAPVYLQDLFSERNTDYNLLDAFRKLNLPKPRTDYLKRSFLFFVFMWRHYFPKLKITNPSAVLVLWDVRSSNDLTFCNVSARHGFSIC